MVLRMIGERSLKKVMTVVDLGYWLRFAGEGYGRTERGAGRGGWLMAVGRARARICSIILILDLTDA